jgi:hypothetical protein
MPKGFAIMATRRDARRDRTSRERTNAPAVPAAGVGSSREPPDPTRRCPTARAGARAAGPGPGTATVIVTVTDQQPISSQPGRSLEQDHSQGRPWPAGRRQRIHLSSVTFSQIKALQARIKKNVSLVTVSPWISAGLAAFGY